MGVFGLAAEVRGTRRRQGRSRRAGRSATGGGSVGSPSIQIARSLPLGGSLIPSTRFQASGAAVGGGPDPGRPAPAGLALVVPGGLVVDAAPARPASAVPAPRPSPRSASRPACGSRPGERPLGQVASTAVALAEPQARRAGPARRSPAAARPASPPCCRGRSAVWFHCRPVCRSRAPRRTESAARPRPAPRRASAPRRRGRRSASACAAGDGRRGGGWRDPRAEGTASAAISRLGPWTS